MDQQYRIGSGDISATIDAQGAELCSLQADGAEYMWQAGLIWPRHAPVLFPIVGRLPGDQMRHDGKSSRMTQHGFVRNRRFELVEQSATHCRLALDADAETLAAYPFRFRFEATYEVVEHGLRMTYVAINTGDSVMPASIGGHPAFQWPLPGSTDKLAHTLIFERPEPAPIRSVVGGLLQAESRPSPVAGRELHPTPELFAADALIFDQLASHSVRFAAPGTSALELSWENCPYLGIWTKGDGDFLCIEPWHGISTPQEFDADFATKPGLMLIEPGGRNGIVITVRILAAG